MLDYWVRLHRQHELPVAQFVIVLEETGTDIPAEFRAVNTWHRYNVLKLWEQDVAGIRDWLGLLPLAPLMRSANPERLLALVAEQLMRVEPLQERRELVACAHVLAGLRFDAALVKTLFPEEVMQESVTYQDILQRGLQQGVQQGMHQGMQQGMQQGKSEMVLRLLTHRFGPLEAAVKARVTQLEAPQLDQLSEALLDFQRESELLNWLKQHA